MPTVTYKSIIEGAYRLGGGDPEQLSAADKLALIEFAADRTREAWEYYRWPEQMKTEERFYRYSFDTHTFYYEGDEIYYNGKYYTCSISVIYGASPDATTNWVELTDFRKWIPWEQTGQTEIEAVLQVWDVDPRIYATALPVPFKLEADGISLDPDVDVTSVWVEFRARCPELAGTIYDATTTYAVGDIVYYAPDIYEVATATNAGDSPATTPDKFTLKQVPYRLALAVKRGTYADWLSNDEQEAKASKWEGKFTDALDEQVWQITKLQGQTGRPNVSV